MGRRQERGNVIVPFTPVVYPREVSRPWLNSGGSFGAAYGQKDWKDGETLRTEWNADDTVRRKTTRGGVDGQDN